MELDPDTLAALAEKCGYKVAALAKGLGVSVKHLARLFHRHFGKPPRTWLTELRMKRALVLLAEHRRTRKVADKLGYKSPASFITAFKKVHGLLPSKWVAALYEEPMKSASHKAGKRRRSRYYRILSELESLTEGERERIAIVCVRMNRAEMPTKNRNP